MVLCVICQNAICHQNTICQNTILSSLHQSIALYDIRRWCKRRVFHRGSVSHDVSFLLSVNNEDTLHGLVNAYSISSHGKIVYRWGRYTLFARLLRTGVLQRSGVRVYMHSAASKAPTSLRKRPGFSRSVSFRFSFSSATSFSFVSRPTVPRVTSLRQELSDFLGYEYAAGGCKRLGAMVLVMRWMGKRGIAQAKKNVRRSKKPNNAISTCKQDDNVVLIITSP